MTLKLPQGVALCQEENELEAIEHMRAGANAFFDHIEW